MNRLSILCMAAVISSAVAMSASAVQDDHEAILAQRHANSAIMQGYKDRTKADIASRKPVNAQQQALKEQIKADNVTRAAAVAARDAEGHVAQARTMYENGEAGRAANVALKEKIKADNITRKAARVARSGAGANQNGPGPRQ